VTLYLIGALARRLFGFPASVAMLAIAVVLKLARAVSPSLQLGAFHFYKFFSTAVTYPLLFAIGVSLMPWDKVVAAFHGAPSHNHRLDATLPQEFMSAVPPKADKPEPT
jgi:Na+/citrate or Na+/malate symporter